MKQSTDNVFLMLLFCVNHWEKETEKNWDTVLKRRLFISKIIWARDIVQCADEHALHAGGPGSVPSTAWTPEHPVVFFK